MKSEPDVYSIADLERDRHGIWEGVRNFQARNHLRAMRAGELALFYHSSCDPPGVAGLLRVGREAHPDPTQFDPGNVYFDPKSKPDAPRWSMVEVAFVERFPTFVSLGQIKTDPRLSGMLVARRGMRLSVQPVEPEHFARILQLGGARTPLA